MECENEFCIYENNGLCILDKISLDVQGSCKNCIYVNFDDNELKKIKKNTLIELKEYTAD